MIEVGAVGGVEGWLAAVTAALIAFTLIGLYRAFKGPTMQDRVIALNVVGTNAVLVIALLAVVFDEASFLDVALVYALLNFLMSIAVSKFTVERGGVL